jgi:5-methylcytosine-specific restriction protein A
MASSLLHDDVAEARKASAAFAPPLCEMCLKDGRTNAATIADHIEPHKGDQQKFFFGELQSLCKLHHESAKKRKEARGYSTRVGADGWPVDPRHPVYSRGRGA